MTIYLAGPITGNEGYRDEFKYAERELEGAGHDVLSPAWLPERGLSYDAYIRIGIAMLAECDAVCMLHGWEQSSGASMERALAGVLGKKVLQFEEWMEKFENWMEEWGDGSSET